MRSHLSIVIERHATDEGLNSDTFQSPGAAWRRRFSFAVAFIVVAAGLSVIAGRILDVPLLQGATFKGITVKFNTAVCFLLLGTSLLFLVGPVPKAWTRLVGQAAALLALLIGAATLFQHISGISVGVDEMFFHESPGELATVSPGRTGPPASTAFVLLGSALFLLHRRTSSAAVPQALGLLTFFIAMLPFTGYLYGAELMYGVAHFSGIAAPTAVALALLGLAVIASRAEHGPADVLLRQDAGGVLARRMLPAVLIIPLLFGWLAIRGWRAQLFDTRFVVASLVLALILLLTVFVARTAAELTARDRLRQRAENQVRRSRSELVSLVDNASIGLCGVNADGIILWANQAELDMLGYSSEEFVGHHLSEFHVDQALVADTLRRVAGGERLQEHETRMKCRDGSIKTVSINSSALLEDGQFVHTQCFTTDVTERKKVEAATAQLANVVQFSDDAIITTDLDRVVTSWNSSATHLFGYSAAEMLGRPIEVLIPEEFKAEEPQILARLRRGEIIDHYETKRLHKDGRTIDVSISVSPMRARNGSIIGASKIARDITERKRSARALAESEDRFKSMVNAMPQLAWIARADGYITWYNDRWYQYTGTTPKDMEGWGWQRVHDPDVLPRVLERWKLSLHSGQPFEMEFPIRAADGRFRSFLTRVVPLRSAQGEIIQWLGTNTDVSELDRVRTELAAHKDRLEELVLARTQELEIAHQERRRAERMAALGSLSAGLGHDMGNLILPIRMRLETLGEAELTPMQREDIEAINASVNYLQRLSNGLKLLTIDTSQSRAATDRTDLAAWWLEFQSLLKAAIPRGVAFSATVPTQDPSVDLAIAPAALSQCVFNLVQNACEAIAKAPGVAGRITITIDTASNQARITVSDNGAGMSPEVLSRCLEPFFTTKVRAMSTGMGLSLVRGLVEQAGGTVAAASREGEGSTFTLLIPIRSALDAPVPSHPSKCTAAVSLVDPKLRTLVLLAMNAAGADVRIGDPIDSNDVDVWVVQDGAGVDAAALRFIAARPNGQTAPPRRVVVLTQTPIDDSANAPLAGPITRVHSAVDSAKLRSILSQSISSQPAPTA